MKVRLLILVLAALSLSAAMHGQTGAPAPGPATLAGNPCDHFSAVCGGYYISTLPNCSGGPEIYDLNAGSGVHITATASGGGLDSGFPTEVAIVDPAGTQVAVGTDSVEYTTVVAGVHQVQVSSASTGSYALTLACSPQPTCVASPAVICLNNDRFAVSAAWHTATGSGQGKGVELTGDTGYFWFFDPANVELVTKVLNGCALTNAYWVFAGGLTNVQVVLTVVDMQAGIPAFYYRTAGPAFDPVQDTQALKTCP